MTPKAWAVAIGLICMGPVIVTCMLYGFVLLLIWLFGNRAEE